MLKKLIRSFTQAKWQHEDAGIRLQAIEQITDSQHDILEKIAREDVDAQVRAKAIEKINDKNALLTLSENSKIAAQALKRWVEVLNDSQHTSAYDAEQIIAHCSDAKHLGAIITYSHNNSFPELALAGITDESAIIKLIEDSKSSRLWQQAIGKINSEANLKKAATLVKGRDKGASQQIKQKLAALQQQSDRLKNINTEQQRLQNKAEQLLNSHTPLHLEGEILNLQQQWQTLLNSDTENAINAETQQQFTSSVEQLSNQLQQQQQTIAETKEQAALQQAEKADFNAASNIKTQLQQNPLDNEVLQQSQDVISKLNIQNHKKLSAQINQHFTLNASLQAFKLLTQQDKTPIEKLGAQALENSLKRCEELLPQTRKLDIESSVVTRLENLQSQLKQQQQSQIKTSQAIETQLSQLLEATENNLDDNEIDQARKNLKQLKRYSEKLNKKQLHKYQPAISRIHKRLEALDDWKTYSTEPKREALLQAMQGLVAAQLTAELRLNKIKDLQQQWKALGYCQNQDLWKTFQKASDEAYAPCKENFDQQKNLREFNAQQRTTICEQLEQFVAQQDLNSQELDWRSIEKLNRSIIQEWKKFSPVDPKKNKALQKRFSTSFDAINHAIHQQQLNAEQALQSLCDEAQELNSAEDKQQAINNFQQLLQQWKTVSSQGTSRHKQQQNLWALFKQAGDALYEGRQSQFQAAEQESLDNGKKATDIIKQIQDLATAIKQKTQSEIGVDQQAFQQAQKDFYALGALPKNKFKSLKQGFESASESINDAITQAANNSWQQQLQALVSFGETCSALEIENAGNIDSSIPENFSAKWRDAVQTRFSNSLSADELTQAARTLCIEMEKLNGLDTPEADSTLKMQLQMQQLANNFGQQQNQTYNEQLEELYLRWFALPCWNKALHDQLQQRFLNALKSA
ncbi:MAG: DUF349 domain-containing protein [Pseudomonadales bacterium]|nr:DUF349 domain-containing protein [Pseudomonadales bacterium]